MEPVDSETDSPVLVCKAKDNEVDTSVTGDQENTAITRNLRSKSKALEKDDSAANLHESADIAENVESTGDEINGDKTETNGYHNGNDVEENDDVYPQSEDETLENGMAEEQKNKNEEFSNLEESTTGSEATIPVIVDGDDDIEEETNGLENCNGDSGSLETECSAKNVIPLPYKNSADEVVHTESFPDKSQPEVNGVSDSATNGTDSERKDEPADMYEISLKGSDDDSFYESVEMAKEVQVSPDTGSQADNSFTNRISNFLGKWQTSSPPPLKEKQDLEISSTKKVTTANEPVMPHPYLSKVTGRRGIKTRINVNGAEAEMTPKNRGPSLSDSFRVKTDPPRLNQANAGLEPVLRKFKGKRCLNVNDDFDDENGYENGDDLYPSSTKRRKLDEKTAGSGFLGNMLWSPFKKKSDNTRVTQSKLSRFLSPFWFWKKTVTDHERK